MKIEAPVILSANLVLIGVDLLANPDALNQFRKETDPDLQVQFGTVTEVPSGATEQSRTVALNRERIVLNSSPSRSAITKEYPKEEDLEKLSEIATSAIKASMLEGKNPRFYGYNIELVYDPKTGESASEHIGRCLFGGRSLGKEEWELSGGNGQITFKDEDHTREWVLSIRPRSSEASNSLVFMGLNLHYNEQRMPNEVEIKNSLEELWNAAHDFVRQFGQGEQ